MIRLGFIGLGWIGRNRMEAMLASREAVAAAICDSNLEAIEQAHSAAPGALMVQSFDAMLALDLDGIVVATPNALHAEQCIAALNRGVAVFCQKPLGRNAAEVAAVLAAAERADRPLGVDLSYRCTAAMQAIKARVEQGELGNLFAADLVFHNAYGPGAGWFWDPELSGGGCMLDLGVHLVDLPLWLLDFPEVTRAEARLWRQGREVAPDEVEDYASATLELVTGAQVRIACSWNLSAGTDAIIGATFYGSKAGAEFRNENGSYFDFTADLFRGRERERLASPPDGWGGRAALDWLQKLKEGQGFAGTTHGLLQTAQVLDRLYARS